MSTKPCTCYGSADANWSRHALAACCVTFGDAVRNFVMETQDEYQEAGECHDWDLNDQCYRCGYRRGHN